MLAQQLRVLPGTYVIELLQESGPPAGDWLWSVRGPEGLTVVRPVAGDGAEADRESWVPLYSGDTAHGLDVPGMLAALLTPLASHGVPVFVASTHDADLILVPRDRLDEAALALSSAGHHVTGVDPRS
ncbi:ACT domain-containing protein [Kitasatospora brasiliensis]|uniref:ACT domain-containing protein n=1 Tax=Kitasatospora brasiliensis TaxID=3058040 RepID=UPI00292D8FF4|nr:ACT domain-containing protein [Kitasatospora sp. K002]